MFALVESGSITKFFSGNQPIAIGDKQYPKQIFTLWSKAEREAIGIYEVEIDNSKRKDEQWYINTNVTFARSCVSAFQSIEEQSVSVDSA